MGLAPADGHDAAHGANVGRAHIYAAVLQMHQVCQLIQQRVVAADDHQGVFQLVLPAQKPHLHLLPGLIALHPLGDGEDAVGLHEAGDHAAAPAQGGSHQFVAHIAHPHPDKLLVLQARDYRPGQGSHGRGCGGGAGFQPVFDQGLQQFFDHDDAGHRVAGHAQNGLCPHAAQDGGLAGLHGDAVVQHLPQFPDDFGGKILPPGGGAGVENHQVALRRRLGDSGLDLIELVRHNGIGPGLRPPLAQHGGENGGVELHDVPRPGVGTGRDDLVPGGDDAHQGLADHRDLQHAPGDHGPDGRRAYLHVGREDHFPGANVLADLADVLPGCGGSMDGDGAVGVFHDVLHHDHGVLVLGDGVAGVQNGELLRPEGDRRGLRGAEGMPGNDRHAVHGAGGIVGRADMGVDRLGRDPAAGLLHRDHLGSGGVALFHQQGKIVPFRLLQRHIGEIFKSHKKFSYCLISLFFIGLLPEFPPLPAGPRSPGRCRKSRRPRPGW